jgi:hypothetical protein
MYHYYLIIYADILEKIVYMSDYLINYCASTLCNMFNLLKYLTNYLTNYLASMLIEYVPILIANMRDIYKLCQHNLKDFLTVDCWHILENYYLYLSNVFLANYPIMIEMINNLYRVFLDNCLIALEYWEKIYLTVLARVYN